MYKKSARLLAGFTVLLGFTLVMTSCSNGSINQARVKVVFDPVSVTLTQFQGDTSTFQQKVYASGDLSGTVYAVILDKDGVLQPDPSIVQQADQSYIATLKTVATLAVGEHRGTLELHLCADPNCNAEFSGSPWRLPYNITVQSHTNLKTLSAWPGIDDWKMYQRDSAHTGHVGVIVNPSAISPRWLIGNLSGTSVPYAVSPMVTEGNRVFATTQGSFFGANTIWAVNEADGSIQWSFNFGDVAAVNPPATDNGRVFVATSGHESTAMWGFNQADGNEIFSTPFAAQWERYYSPTIESGTVYTDGGYYGGAYAFNSDGAEQWFTQLPQYDQWTPAVDGNHIYAYFGETCGGCSSPGLMTLDKSTGAVLSNITDPNFSWHGWSIYGAPIVISDTSVLMVNGGYYQNLNSYLVSFNPTASNINWSVSGSFPGNPAVAGSTIYIGNSATRSLEARNSADGSVVWSWTMDQSESRFYSDTIATDNLVFVSTDQAVHAISMTTHSEVWKYPRAGALAISKNGVLYIARAVNSDNGLRSDGSLAAVNLK